MNRLFLIIALVLVCFFSYAQKVVFYSDTLLFTMVSKAVPLFVGKTEEKKDVLAYYEDLNNCNFLKEVSQQLDVYKKEYILNDFYMAQILEKLCLLLAPKVSNKHQKMLMYCVLRYMKYDVRLAYLGNNYFVLAFSDTELFNHPYLLVKNKKYYSIHRSSYKSSFSSSIDYIISDNHKFFTYSIANVPLLKKPIYENKNILLYKSRCIFYDEKSESYLRGKIKEIVVDTVMLNFIFNKSLIDLYKDLPIIENSKYFNLDLSDSLHKQVFQYLESQKLGLTKQDTLKNLVKFVRSIGEYKTDIEAYKREFPMFPEEALYYMYTDCEDRNALLFYLTKKVLNLPMIILDYPNHINIGVAIKGNYKQSVKYKGGIYYVCEASSGGAVVEIGESNAFNTYPHPKIIGEYIPVH